MSVLRFALPALFALGAVAACGGGSPSQTATGGSAGAGGKTTTTSTGTGTGGDGGGILIGGCDPPCIEGQICSVAHTCINAGTCISDVDCNAGLVCDPDTHTCKPGGGCGTMSTTVAAIPPNLLIVLDRSCSMTAKVGGTPKWNLAVDAVNKMTTDFTSHIRFGLTLFPDLDTPNCDQSAIPIPVAAGNESAIQTLLTASLSKNDKYYPDGPCVTNIDAGIHQASLETALMDAARQNYVLLITDGMQSSGCKTYGGDNGTTQMITDLYQQQKVATFVIGFGGEVDPAQLNKFADAGGVPTGDPMTHFYKAEDGTSLDQALSSIATKTLSCTFALMDVPPDPSQIFVFLDQGTEPLGRDTTHMSGWDYDASQNQITFYGATCDMLKAGTVSDLHVVFGCGSGSAD